MAIRRTVVHHGSLIRRNLLLEAARSGETGLQLMSFEQLAARLAGGFSSGVDNKALRDAIRKVLPVTDLGELDPIKALPGMIPAAAETLQKVWRADIDLASYSPRHDRIDSIAVLEKAALAQLPPMMRRPADLVVKAMEKLHLAKTILGEVQIVGVTELSPVWRKLLHALAGHTKVEWFAGPRSLPSWLDENLIKVTRTEASRPDKKIISAATAYHEAIEAVRWARELLASGNVKPSEIALVSTMPSDYDDHFIALRSDANIDICFVHGVKVTTTRAGQAAAALADILVRGLSQTRIRRLAPLLSAKKEPFGAFPQGWIRVLPQDAPLMSLDAWNKFLDRLSPEKWPEQNDQSASLRKIVSLLAQGTDAATDTGMALLSGQALAIWKEALKTGSAAAIDVSINNLRISEYANAPESIAWMTANELAAAPRPYVRMLGMNSSKWPRGQSEDRLLSDHVIETSVLDPLPINAADRRDYETICATTEKELVMSFSRRDSEGRLLGKSPLLPNTSEEIYLQRNNIPTHAMSETDRLLARGNEFSADTQGRSATACWRAWLSPEISAYDGLIRSNHPVVERILNRNQSASSLKKLLRYPISFLWQYGLHLSTPDSAIEPIVLEPNQLGDLIHETLEHALTNIQKAGGLAKATEQQIEASIDEAAINAALQWETQKPTPPKLIWDLTIKEIKEVSFKALTFRDDLSADMSSYCEVPFGGAKDEKRVSAPWDTQKPVIIPGANFRINGYIDRLDISSDGATATVKDYKTGKTPKQNDRGFRINGGKELQRCLYAFAVKALLGKDINVKASLFYPRDQLDLILDDPEDTLLLLEKYLKLARENLMTGTCLIGPDSDDNYDEFSFALPANAGAIYVKRKMALVREKYGEYATVWEAE